MNSTRTTEDRIEWTSESLNLVLPLISDIQDLQIQKRQQEVFFVKGTLEDATKMKDHLSHKIGVTPAQVERRTRWRPDFWYTQVPDIELNNVLPQAKKEIGSGPSSRRHYKKRPFSA